MVAAREPTARAGAVELADIPARGLAYRPSSGGPVLFKPGAAAHTGRLELTENAPGVTGDTLDGKPG